MSSLYARATAARPKPSKTSRGRVGSIYLPAKSRLLRPLIAPRALRLCPPSRTWLRAVTFSLGGSSATIIITEVLYPSGPARTLTLYTVFAIPPPASRWIIAEKGSQQHACLPPVARSRTRRSSEWHLVEGWLPSQDAALTCPRRKAAQFIHC